MSSIEFTIAQQNVLAIVPCFTGFISIVADWFILRHVYDDGKINFMRANEEHGGGEPIRSVSFKSVWMHLRVYDRLMCSLSVSDMFHSFWLALSQLPAPKDSVGAVFALGNDLTCNIAGSFLIYGFMTRTWYHAVMCLLFARSIKYRRDDGDGLYYYLCQILTIGFSIAGSIIPLYFGGYHKFRNFNSCQPLAGCNNAWHSEYCHEQGLNTPTIPLVVTFYKCQLVLAVLISIFSSIAVYLYGRKLCSTNCQRVGLVSFMFFLAYLLTAIWFIIQIFLQNFTIALLNVTFYPLMGLLNYLVFMHRRRVGQEIRNRLCYNSHNNNSNTAVGSNNLREMIQALDIIEDSVKQNSDIVLVGSLDNNVEEERRDYVRSVTEISVIST